MNQEPVYFIKKNELDNLVANDSKPDRIKVAQDIVLRGSPLAKWDSTAIIGIAKKRHKLLERKGWDWRSFYNGWGEGRMDMLNQFYKMAYGDDCYVDRTRDPKQNQ